MLKSVVIAILLGIIIGIGIPYCTLQNLPSKSNPPDMVVDELGRGIGRKLVYYKAADDVQRVITAVNLDGYTYYERHRRIAPTPDTIKRCIREVLKEQENLKQDK